MVRPKVLSDSEIVSVRIEKDVMKMLRDIAALESLHTSTVVSANELIRNAISFVYSDNERLRECFRRSRRCTNKKFK